MGKLEWAIAGSVALFITMVVVMRGLVPWWLWVAVALLWIFTSFFGAVMIHTFGIDVRQWWLLLWEQEWTPGTPGPRGDTLEAAEEGLADLV